MPRIKKFNKRKYLGFQYTPTSKQNHQTPGKQGNNDRCETRPMPDDNV